MMKHLALYYPMTYCRNRVLDKNIVSDFEINAIIYELLHK